MISPFLVKNDHVINRTERGYHFRSILQKTGVQYTKDEIDTLVRCIKLCIETPA